MDSSNMTALDGVKNHPNIVELPNTIFVCPTDREDDSVLLYTMRLSNNNGTRGTVDVSIWPTAVDHPPDAIDNMRGTAIRLCTLMYPPYVYYSELTDPEQANARYDPKYKQDDLPLFLDGTEVMLLLEFCRKHNCTIEASFDEVSLWGEVFDNHTGTGLLGAVVERRADIAMAAIYFWRQPYKFAAYVLPISRSGITVLVPKPRMLAPWRTPFLSFSGYLWIAVFIAFCVGALAVWLIEKVRYQILRPSNETPITISDAMLTMIGFYMEQSARMRTDMASCVCLFTSLLFAGFMVGNSYGGGLAGVMTLPQYEKPIDTTRDLAASGMLFAGGALSWIFSMLQSPQPYMQTLVKNYRIRNDDYLSMHTKTLDLGFVGERTEFSHFVPSDFVDNEASTKLQLLKDDLYWESVTAIVTKTSPFRHALDDLIMQVKQSGIQHYWELSMANRYLHTTSQRNI
ncbi:glutamate receptor-like [Wyeomyia smithii]|uniref:glutamate receptor-like n=1 Tax=Wyeomyia smithii TaxID=174621 RepID=UPI002468130D|nr:glutamate receptor-like [Wyeomyia smithii]